MEKKEEKGGDFLSRSCKGGIFIFLFFFVTFIEKSEHASVRIEQKEI